MGEGGCKPTPPMIAPHEAVIASHQATAAAAPAAFKYDSTPSTCIAQCPTYPTHVHASSCANTCPCRTLYKDLSTSKCIHTIHTTRIEHPSLLHRGRPSTSHPAQDGLTCANAMEFLSTLKHPASMHFPVHSMTTVHHTSSSSSSTPPQIPQLLKSLLQRPPSDGGQ